MNYNLQYYPLPLSNTYSALLDTAFLLPLPPLIATRRRAVIKTFPVPVFLFLRARPVITITYFIVGYRVCPPAVVADPLIAVCYEESFRATATASNNDSWIFTCFHFCILASRYVNIPSPRRLLLFIISRSQSSIERRRDFKIIRVWRISEIS